MPCAHGAGGPTGSNCPDLRLSTASCPTTRRAVANIQRTQVWKHASPQSRLASTGSRPWSTSIVRTVRELRPEKISGRSIDVQRTSTRKEELLLTKEELNKVYLLRNFLSDMPPVEAIEFLLERLKRTKTNTEFFQTMSQG